MRKKDSFEQLMLDLRSASQSKRDQGTKFEKLMQQKNGKKNILAR